MSTCIPSHSAMISALSCGKVKETSASSAANDQLGARYVSGLLTLYTASLSPNLIGRALGILSRGGLLGVTTLFHSCAAGSSALGGLGKELRALSRPAP